jgi:hypothetical protein
MGDDRVAEVPALDDVAAPDIGEGNGIRHA